MCMEMHIAHFVNVKDTIRHLKNRIYWYSDTHFTGDDKLSPANLAKAFHISCIVTFGEWDFCSVFRIVIMKSQSFTSFQLEKSRKKTKRIIYLHHKIRPYSIEFCTLWKCLDKNKRETIQYMVTNIPSFTIIKKRKKTNAHTAQKQNPLDTIEQWPCLVICE